MDLTGNHIPQMTPRDLNERAIVLVDCSDPKDIPSFVPPEAVRIVIDHRSYVDTLAFSNSVKWISLVGSCATLISLLYHRLSIKPTVETAKLLYLAIMSNTVMLRTENTSNKDKAAAEWLGNISGTSYTEILKMFEEKSRIAPSKIAEALDNDTSSKCQIIFGKRVAISQLEIMKVELFLEQNGNFVNDGLHEVKAARKADNIFLIAQDISAFSTYIYYLPEHFQDASLENILPCKLIKPGLWILTGGMKTRKTIIKRLLENFHSKM